MWRQSSDKLQPLVGESPSSCCLQHLLHRDEFKTLAEEQKDAECWSEQVIMFNCITGTGIVWRETEHILTWSSIVLVFVKTRPLDHLDLKADPTGPCEELVLYAVCACY